MIRVVFNRKGGVGKSTILVNLASVAAERGRNTLVLDLDPQANATHYLLGVEAAELQPTLADFFGETLGFHLLGTPTHDFVHPTQEKNLSIIPGTEAMAELQPKLESRYKIYKLRDFLHRLRGTFDEIFIDTPPAVNFFTQSALIAADRCLIPFDCDEFSRRALYQLLGTVREVKEDHNDNLEVEGIVVNQFQERARLPRTLVKELQAEGLPVLQPHISASVKVRESHQVHRPLVRYLPRHKVSEQFRELWDSLQTS